MSPTGAVTPPWVNTRCGCMPRRHNAVCLAWRQIVWPLFVNRSLVSLRLDPQLNFPGAATPSGFTEQAMLITCRYAYARRPASSEICPPSRVGYSLIGSNLGTSRQFCSVHGNNRKLTCCTFRPLVSLQAISVLIGFPEGDVNRGHYSLANIVSSIWRAARVTCSGFC